MSMQNIIFFTLSAFLEIAGCFALWVVVKQGKSAYWLVPGIISLVMFAFFLTKIDTNMAGRAFATYGGIYIASTIVWLYFAEGFMPDKGDIMGAGICILGAMIILFFPR
jgi:small multidrug resistance family-3 protein